MNHVELTGRLSGPPEERQLPSGDLLVVFRLVVSREEGGRVDTIDCSVSSASLRRRLLRTAEGTELHIEGALHRRFWRGAQGLASRYEVSVHAMSRAA